MLPLGVTNLGNTCFLGSVLYALFHAPSLTAYVLSGVHTEDLFGKRVNACTVATEYAGMVTEAWKPVLENVLATSACLDPGALWRSLAKLHRPFAKNVQHDAHECLMVLLDALNTAWAKTPKVPDSVIAAHLGSAPDVEAWDAFTSAKGYSMISEIFVAQVRVKGSQPSYEHLLGLSVALTASTLDACLDDYFKPVQLGNVLTTREVVYLPLVLVVHLKRWIGPKTKNDRFVSYPDALDLSRFTPGHASAYQLFAVVCHTGSPSEGHYTCYAEAGTRWTHADDGRIIEVDNINDIVTKDAYLLLYKKRL